MENGHKQDTQVQVEAPDGTEPRGTETLCAPLGAERAPEPGDARESAPEAVTRAHSGTHGAPEAAVIPASPAAELRQAAATMRRLTGPAAEPIAKLLEDTAELHEPGRCGKPTANGGTCGAEHGCQWCNDEDWPCADTRNALAVARAINGDNAPAAPCPVAAENTQKDTL